jgi:hypothetical protein
MCGTSRRVVDLIEREIKILQTNPDFEVKLVDIKGALPEILINGRQLECDYKNYKAILHAFKSEIDALKN